MVPVCRCGCFTGSSAKCSDSSYCSDAPTPPRTSSFTCCGTRSPFRAAPIHGRGWTGRTGPSSPPRPAAASGAALPSPGHPGHDPALASPPRPPTLDLSQPVRTATDRQRTRRPRGADGPGEPMLGLPANPRRAAQARPPCRRLDDPPDSTATASHQHQCGTPTPAGGSSCTPRPPACSRSTSSTSTARSPCDGSTSCSHSTSATATSTSWA
jgi:hypothetical protein